MEEILFLSPSFLHPSLSSSPFHLNKVSMQSGWPWTSIQIVEIQAHAIVQLSFFSYILRFSDTQFANICSCLVDCLLCFLESVIWCTCYYFWWIPIYLFLFFACGFGITLMKLSSNQKFEDSIEYSNNCIHLFLFVLFYFRDGVLLCSQADLEVQVLLPQLLF